MAVTPSQYHQVVADVTTPPIQRAVRPDGEQLRALRQATLSRAYVSLGTRRTGSPHEFYRYPARFSPQFAANVIQCFTPAGGVVLDPFIGGGTTAVEGFRLGRHVIGADLNPLATFVTRAKVTSLDAVGDRLVRRWLATVKALRVSQRASASVEAWRSAGYFKDLTTGDTWRLRHLTALAIDALPNGHTAASSFCRCILLRTAQWALDMRAEVPSLVEYRSALVDNGTEMLGALRAWCRSLPRDAVPPTVIDAGVPGLGVELKRLAAPTPHLLLTSPPYPGVYVIYHRWKLRGRREIPAPYWIAGREDGRGMSHYTMGARAEKTLNLYFSRLHEAYADLIGVIDGRTTIVQLVGFSDSSEQLQRYLKVMEDVGLEEFTCAELATADDGRLWRNVPNRRWWTEAQAKKDTAPHTSREVVLLHQLRK